MHWVAQYVLQAGGVGTSTLNTPVVALQTPLGSYPGLFTDLTSSDMGLASALSWTSSSIAHSRSVNGQKQSMCVFKIIDSLLITQRSKGFSYIICVWWKFPFLSHQSFNMSPQFLALRLITYLTLCLFCSGLPHLGVSSSPPPSSPSPRSIRIKSEPISPPRDHTLSSHHHSLPTHHPLTTHHLPQGRYTLRVSTPWLSIKRTPSQRTEPLFTGYIPPRPSKRGIFSKPCTCPDFVCGYSMCHAFIEAAGTLD